MMKRWSTARWRRTQQLGFYLAAIGLPFYFAKFNPKDFSPPFVTVVIVFCLCAGFLSGGTRSATDSSTKRAPDDQRDNDSEPESEAPIDPLVREIRKVVRRFTDRSPDDRRVALVR